MARLKYLLVVALAALVVNLAGCDLFGGSSSSSSNGSSSSGGGGGGGGGGLAAPTGVSATQNLYFDTVLVNWTAVTGAAQYYVGRSSSASGPFTTIGSISSGTAAANTTSSPSSYPITQGSHYFYEVAAVDSSSVVGTYSTPVEGWSNTYLFNDSFEDGNYSAYPTWAKKLNKSGNTWQVTTPGANGSNYALSFTQTNSGTYDGFYTALTTSVTAANVSFWVKTSSTTAANTGEIVLADSSSSGWMSVRFYMANNGNMYVEDNGLNKQGGTAYSSNTWYHVEFKNMNWTTHRYDFYVNGALKASSVSMWDSAPSNIGTIYLMNEGNAQAWWDEIIMN